MLDRARDERGVVLPTRLTAVAVGALVVGGLVLAFTGSGDHGQSATPAASTPSVSATPRASATPSTKPVAKKKTPVVRRNAVYVEIYNNSNIHGLAGRTAARAQAVGWNVVGSDNWHGNVEAPTVYYPARLHAAAKVLARDLGITRLKPAIDPMRMDRLTVILTAGYQ